MSFKSSGPSVALVSYPGSGNFWVRQLLESATGIYTGAIYCDTAYVGAGMIGEFIDTRNVLAIKTHSAPSTSLQGQYDKVIIYIVRNPFCAILAEHNQALAASAPKLYGKSHTADVNYKYIVIWRDFKSSTYHHCTTNDIVEACTNSPIRIFHYTKFIHFCTSICHLRSQF